MSSGHPIAGLGIESSRFSVYNEHQLGINRERLRVLRVKDTSHQAGKLPGWDASRALMEESLFEAIKVLEPTTRMRRVISQEYWLENDLKSLVYLSEVFEDLVQALLLNQELA